mgnify:CR=1 FL=1
MKKIGVVLSGCGVFDGSEIHEAVFTLLAIDQAGMSSAYEAWANSPSRTFVERAFIGKAMTWRRDDPILLGASTALGLTETQLDELFVLASTL